MNDPPVYSPASVHAVDEKAGGKRGGGGRGVVGSGCGSLEGLEELSILLCVRRKLWKALGGCGLGALVTLTGGELWRSQRAWKQAFPRGGALGGACTER